MRLYFNLLVTSIFIYACASSSKETSVSIRIDNNNNIIINDEIISPDDVEAKIINRISQNDTIHIQKNKTGSLKSLSIIMKIAQKNKMNMTLR